MKKYISFITITWIASILFLLAYSPESDNSFMVDINRIHETAAEALLTGQDIVPAETSAIQSIKIVDKKQLTSEQTHIFFTGTDIKGDDMFIILPVEDKDYFIRYSVKTAKASNIPLGIFLSLTPIIALFALIKIQKDVMKPLREMSFIPEQLAKGNFIYPTKQHKSKIFHHFLWGLDMLRAKLDDQKDMNLRLEKERKTLVASLTHDIKTPLSSIINYGTAVKDGIYSSETEIHNTLDVMLEKAVKIERLADELLASSVNAIEETAVEVSGHYLNELFQSINRTVCNRIALLKMEYTIEPPENNYIVLTDMDRFIEVCDNIIENAVKYGNLGSLSIVFSNEKQYTLIAFENTGAHIPETELKHVFSSFYRGSNAGSIQGHGLGLYIARKIMRAMEGDIYVQNTDTGVKIVLILSQNIDILKSPKYRRTN